MKFKSLQKNTLKLTLCAAVLFCGSTNSFAAHHENAFVAVSQIVEHPALDACRNGLLKGLEDAGYVEGKNLTFKWQSAQGKIDIAHQIAKQFISESPNVLVGIATPTAQALVQNTTEIPIVFTAVTDPRGASLVDNYEQPSGNVTGISDLSPVNVHMQLIKRIWPDAKSVGVVYNPAEANAVALVNLVKEHAPKNGLEFIEGTINNSSEIGTATDVVASKADVIYAITDNTVASAIAGLVDRANRAQTPVFGAETSYADAGAVIAVGLDYFKVGYETAEYVAGILDGKSPGDFPVRSPNTFDTVVNLDQAKKLNVTLPDDLVQSAIRTISTGY